MRARSCLMAFVLRETRSGNWMKVIWERDKLECVRGGLPFSVHLYLYLYTFINVFGTTLVVDTKLENITVLEFERSGLRVCGR